MSDSKMGWLSPTGEFYQCEMYEHNSMARELYKAYGGNGYEYNADDKLREKGWISITILTFIDHGYCIGFSLHLSPTAEQLRFLRPYYEGEYGLGMIELSKGCYEYYLERA